MSTKVKLILPALEATLDAFGGVRWRGAWTRGWAVDAVPKAGGQAAD